MVTVSRTQAETSRHRKHSEFDFYELTPGITQFCRIKGCGGEGAGPPPPPPPPPPSNIFERKNKPRQIMYHFKGNLWEIPN